MRALEGRVFNAVWAAVEATIPTHHEPAHPLGCHRPRIDDKACFYGIVVNAGRIREHSPVENESTSVRR